MRTKFARTPVLRFHDGGQSAFGTKQARPRLGGRAIRTGSLVLMVLLILTGCGGQFTPESPTASVGSTEVTDLTEEAASPVAASSREQPAGNETPEEVLTLGELIDRINSRWSGLTHFRETNTSAAAPRPELAGSPIAASPVLQRTGRSTREVTLPDRARYRAEENGQLVFEMIVIGEQVFARGTVATLLDPTATGGEWIATDISSVARNPMLGDAAASQLAALSPPTYVVPDRLRPQPVRRLGATTFGERECELYGAADTTNTGARIDFTFGVDPEDLLCFVETRSIGITSQYVVEELDETFAIAAPADARPLASPAATPRNAGTPITRSTPTGTP